MEVFDRKFQIQIFGHVHTQSIYPKEEGKSPIRLQVGSLHPGKGGDSEKYAPMYNILELDVVKGVLKMKVLCYSWDGEQFNKNDTYSYSKKIALGKKAGRTTNQKKEVSKIKEVVEKSDELYKLRFRFFYSNHIKEIINEIEPSFYDKGKPEYVNATAFFKTIASKPLLINKLETALTKYSD
jgi:hypothetical protein